MKKLILISLQHQNTHDVALFLNKDAGNWEIIERRIPWTRDNIWIEETTIEPHVDLVRLKSNMLKLIEVESDLERVIQICDCLIRVHNKKSNIIDQDQANIIFCGPLGMQINELFAVKNRSFIRYEEAYAHSKAIEVEESEIIIFHPSF